MSEVAKIEEGSAVSENAPVNLIEIISRVASDPNCDIDKMERLLQMQERLVEREAEIAFNEAMQAAQLDMPQVLRDAKNDQTNSKYARLETIDKTIKPVIAKHGFSMSFGTEDSPNKDHYRVTCIVSHIGGFSRNYHADIPADNAGMKGTKNKTNTHAFGSSMSYGRRYLKLLIFDIATSDDDGNAADTTYDISPWLDQIRDAKLKPDLNKIANALKQERDIPQNALKLIRNAWSARMKVLK